MAKKISEAANPGKPKEPRNIAEIARVQGKIEIIEGNSQRLEAGIEKLSQEIGDIRRMILDREQSSKDIDVQFHKLQAAMEIIDPQKYAKMIADINSKIDMMGNRVERNERLFSQFRTDIQVIMNVFSKFKNADTMVESLSEINSKLNEIRQAQRFTERLASKTENVFFQFNRDVKEMRSKVQRAEHFEQMVNELLKEVDRLGLMIKSASGGPEVAERIGKFLSRKESFSTRASAQLMLKAKEFEQKSKSLESLRERLEKTEKAAFGKSQLESKLDKLSDSMEKTEQRIVDFESSRVSQKSSLDAKIAKLAQNIESAKAARKETMLEDRMSRAMQTVGRKEVSLESTVKHISQRIEQLAGRMDELEVSPKTAPAGQLIEELRANLQELKEKNTKLEKMVMEIAV